MSRTAFGTCGVHDDDRREGEYIVNGQTYGAWLLSTYMDTGPHLDIFRRVPNIPSSVYVMPISSSSS
jgi:hypothetical protein